MLTVLMDSNKNLILSTRKPVYQGEYKIDEMKIYVPEFYDSYDLSKFDGTLELTDGSNISLQRSLDQIASDKDGYICFLTDINNDVTRFDGIVKMRLILSFNTSDAILKTSQLTFRIAETPDSYKYYVYCGVSESLDEYDNEFINSLANTQKSSRQGSYTREVSKGRYLFVSWPVKFGSIKYFKINSFFVDAIDCGTVYVTDPDGVKQDYYLYRTPQPSTGVTTVVIE